MFDLDAAQCCHDELYREFKSSSQQVRVVMRTVYVTVMPAFIIVMYSMTVLYW